MSDQVKLISITPEAEDLIVYCARVSNPKSQEAGENNRRLLNYCIKNSHWSIFEMANMVVEINTSRAIARQILRHRSFSFQEFSQRYAEVGENFIPVSPRRQDEKNRQNSIDDLPPDYHAGFIDDQQRLWEEAIGNYKHAIKMGIAKECARALLPEGLTPSRMYMNGTIRSWLHYLDLRCGNGTQLEHQEIAREIREIFIKELPAIAEAMGW